MANTRPVAPQTEVETETKTETETKPEPEPDITWLATCYYLYIMVFSKFMRSNASWSGATLHSLFDHGRTFVGVN